MVALCALVLLSSLIPHPSSLLHAFPSALWSFASFPSDISGNVLWLKADSLTLNDGDSVTTWVDSSGNGNDATQTGALRPTYKTGIIGGKPVVRFDGASQGMNVPSGSTELNITGDLTMFVVLKSSSAASQAVAVFGDSSAGTTGFMLYLGNQFAGKASFLSSGNVTWLTQSSAVNNGSGHMVSVVLSGTALTFYKDGSADGSGTSAAPVVYTGTRGIGFSDTGASPFNGDIAELIVFNAALSSGDRARVEAYLRGKYGL